MLARFGLPVDAQGVPYDEVAEAMRLDKKAKDGSLALPSWMGSATAASSPM